MENYQDYEQFTPNEKGAEDQEGTKTFTFVITPEDQKHSPAPKPHIAGLPLITLEDRTPGPLTALEERSWPERLLNAGRRQNLIEEMRKYDSPSGLKELQEMNPAMLAVLNELALRKLLGGEDNQKPGLHHKPLEETSQRRPGDGLHRQATAPEQGSRLEQIVKQAQRQQAIDAIKALIESYKEKPSDNKHTDK